MHRTAIPLLQNAIKPFRSTISHWDVSVTFRYLFTQTSHQLYSKHKEPNEKLANSHPRWQVAEIQHTETESLPIWFSRRSVETQFRRFYFLWMNAADCEVDIIHPIELSWSM